MEMVKLNSLEDYHSLPTTKWRIKQPSIEENRENALTTGIFVIFLLLFLNNFCIQFLLIKFNILYCILKAA